MKVSRYLYIAIAIFLLCIFAPAVSAINGTVIKQGATVFIGEGGLNVTHALNQAYGLGPIDTAPVNTTIGWWASPGQIDTTAPIKTIDLGVGTTPRYKSMEVAQADFVGYVGNWYVYNSSSIVSSTHLAFAVADPSLGIVIWDFNQLSDVTGKSVPQGENLGFQINTNMYPALDGRFRSNPNNFGTFPNSFTDGYITIKVKNENGATLNTLIMGNTSNNKPVPMTGLFVNTQPWFFGSSSNDLGIGDTSRPGYWVTDYTDNNNQYVYPVGTYRVWAESTLNSMKDNYKNAGADYTGKTVSGVGTITLLTDTVKIEANRESVVRSKYFTVTVTGKPKTAYYVWVKGTNSMSSGYDNQPPMVSSNQEGVILDSPVNAGLIPSVHPIGNYQFENGATANIYSDVAQSTVSTFNRTRYYAQITTLASGTRTIEFTTSNWTRAQTYTIRVENKFGAQYKGDEVDVRVEKGAVTVAASGNQTYDSGENIKFVGTNTNNYDTYLFLAGPGLPLQGAQLASTNPKNSPVVNGVPSSFVRSVVNGDNTWEYVWRTNGISLDPGIYTVYAASDPVDALHLNNATSYGSTSIVIKNASITNFIPLYQGWNFISTPKKLLNGNDTAKIFSTVDTMGHSIFLFSSSDQSWHAMTAGDKIRPLDGIWIYSKNPTIVKILFDEDPVQTPPSKILTAGWNAIGFSAPTPAYARDTLVSIRPEWSALIGFDTTNQRYDTAIINGASGMYSDYRYMYPMKGYWVAMRENGTLMAIGA